MASRKFEKRKPGESRKFFAEHNWKRRDTSPLVIIARDANLRRGRVKGFQKHSTVLLSTLGLSPTDREVVKKHLDCAVVELLAAIGAREHSARELIRNRAVNEAGRDSLSST